MLNMGLNKAVESRAFSIGDVVVTKNGFKGIVFRIDDTHDKYYYRVWFNYLFSLDNTLRSKDPYEYRTNEDHCKWYPEEDIEKITSVRKIFAEQNIFGLPQDEVNRVYGPFGDNGLFTDQFKYRSAMSELERKNAEYWTQLIEERERHSKIVKEYKEERERLLKELEESKKKEKQNGIQIRSPKKKIPRISKARKNF